MINRLPAEELLKAVRNSQAEWRSQIRPEPERTETDGHGHRWWTRLPELREAPRGVPEAGRSSFVGV